MLDDHLWLTVVMGWLGFIVEVAGLIVCARFFRVSKRMWLLTLGMAGLVSINLFYVALGLGSMLTEGVSTYDQLMLLTRVFNIVHLVSWTLVVVGLAAVLHDVRRRLAWYENVLRAEKFKDQDPLPSSSVSTDIQATP